MIVTKKALADADTSAMSVPDPVPDSRGPSFGKPGRDFGKISLYPMR